MSVPYVDLDTLCAAGVDLIKCDIEGAKLTFIKTYERLLRSVRYFIVELHSLLCDVEAARVLMKNYGFALDVVLRQEGNVSLELYRQKSLPRSSE